MPISPSVGNISGYLINIVLMLFVVLEAVTSKRNCIKPNRVLTDVNIILVSCAIRILHNQVH